MSLTIKTRKEKDVVILELSGKLSGGEPVLLLRESIRAQLAEGARQFELDIRDVSHIDSSGLGGLVTVYTTIRGQGGSVKLSGMTARSQDLLQMTKLLTVFDPPAGEREAQAAARSPLHGRNYTGRTIMIWSLIVVVAVILYWFVERR